MLDFDMVAVTGEHVRDLHHAGRAAHGYHVSAAGHDIVTLALTDLGREFGLS